MSIINETKDEILMCNYSKTKCLKLSNISNKIPTKISSSKFINASKTITREDIGNDILVCNLARTICWKIAPAPAPVIAQVIAKAPAPPPATDNSLLAAAINIATAKMQPVAQVIAKAPAPAPAPAQAQVPVPELPDNLADLNLWINNEAINMIKNSQTPVVSTLLEAELPNRKLSGFQRMRSSGNNFDCLIHSFFTSINFNFRTLTENDKNTIATKFRRKVLVSLLNNDPENVYGINYQVSANETKKTVISEARNVTYLSEYHIRYLVNKYMINVYLCQGVWYLITPTGTDIVPSGDVIIMYNPGLGHFESVRNPKGDQYIFNIDFISEFVEVNKNICTFKEWNYIIDQEDNIRVVVNSYTTKEGKCITKVTEPGNIINHEIVDNNNIIDISDKVDFYSHVINNDAQSAGRSVDQIRHRSVKSKSKRRTTRSQEIINNKYYIKYKRNRGKSRRTQKKTRT